ncbi:MAG: TonB-dependent receptor [Acidobacteria bacterium]|nr:TonB-dependent receptor [Acidobacteriota bacterium]
MIRITNKRLRFVSSLVMLLALVFGPGSAFSALAALQENTGSIQGTVKDQSGAVIPDAKVTISGTNLIRPIDTKADSKGFYVFPKLPVGTYTVTASQVNFKTVKQEGIMLELGKQLTIDMDLPAGNVSESVTVTASSETIDVTSSKTATNIGESFIDKTPKGRTFNTILQVAPGVRFEPKLGVVAGGPGSGDVTGTGTSRPGGGVGGFSVDGASGSENSFVIDGVDVSNVRNAALGRESALPFEFIREVQVKTGGFEAEYGGATGGVINVVTKSGSNDFHGEGALMFTGAGLNASPRGFWRLNPQNLTQAEFFRQKEDEYRSLFPGYAIGGPLIKDRLHFFSSYFPELSRTERSIAFASGARTTTNRVLRHFSLQRLDYAPTQNIQINTSYIWTPIRNQGVLTGVDPKVAPPSGDLSKLGGYTPASAYTASFNYTVTPKLILSARYGYKYLNEKGNTYGLPTGTLLLYQRATSGSSYVGPAVPASVAGPAGLQNISNPFNVIKDITTRHNVYLDASYITRIFGQQHTFKGGYALNRIANDVSDDYPNGRFDIYWGEAVRRGSIDTDAKGRGTYGYYIWVDGIKHNSSVNSRNQGFYFQDQWQIHPRVTINAGLRVENEFLPPFTSEVNGAKVPNPISFGWGDKIAPRIGGAWDIRGDGRWKFSASYGQFYDTLKYELARTSFGGDYWHDRYYKLDSTDLSSLSKATPGALGALIIDVDNRTIPINAQGQLDGIDPAIKPMSSREWAFTLEHQLNSNNITSVRYTHKRLVRGIEDIGTLDAQENEVYVIGNPGFGQTSDSVKAPNGRASITPKARREYDGVEVRFDGRRNEGVLRGLSYTASYTWSRLYGNWSGLANSDENGRSQPNVSRAFDLFYNNSDSKGNNVFGRLATDRPHAFKFFGNYDIHWGKSGVTSLSLSQIAYSGTPLSSEVTIIVPVFYNGRGDLGRTPALTQTDILVAHTYSVTERVKFKVDANVTNLFNQAAVTNVNTRLNRNGSITSVATPEKFFAGFDAPSLINPVNGASPARSAIYNLPSAYQIGREIRLGFHVTF